MPATRTNDAQKGHHSEKLLNSSQVVQLAGFKQTLFNLTFRWSINKLFAKTLFELSANDINKTLKFSEASFWISFPPLERVVANEFYV